MLEKAYGDVVLSKTRAYEWYKAFKDGREVVEDLPRSGRPSKSSNEENIDKIKTMVLENRHLSLREIARGVNMSHESVRGILVDILGMRRINGDDKWMYENEKETTQHSSEFCSEHEPKPKKPRRSRSEK
ncbi:protein GVQW3-like [Glossina fuscipes]|uniref:Protein GVQW3-like n=1 Tax=Glossina fuscipes TaxID=7396 RepID=A0A9C5Z6I1_9MUSC|nr:protein GVQW3-like [Glossina fuscipes]